MELISIHPTKKRIFLLELLWRIAVSRTPASSPIIAAIICSAICSLINFPFALLHLRIFRRIYDTISQQVKSLKNHTLAKFRS